MPLGWIDTVSESENEIADPRSTFPKEIDFNGTTQEIYNSLMEGILFQPHARNPTMPIERQPTIRFNQPTVSTSTWADATDDELSPDELMELLHLIAVSRSKSTRVQFRELYIPNNLNDLRRVGINRNGWTTSQIS